MVSGKYKITMKYIVLGSKGFIGKNIFNVLMKHNLNVIGLSRDEFDITNINDFKKTDFSNAILIDAIAHIDGNSEKIHQTNVVALKNFIEYLNANCHNFKYVYLSTVSTKFPEFISESDYVLSKFYAEDYIKNHVAKYQIIRLIFPFGRGENSNRLISRLIGKVKNHEKLIINNINLNLTPIQYFNDNIVKIIHSDKTELNFTDGLVYNLRDIVDCIYTILNIEKNYVFNSQTSKDVVIVNNAVVSDLEYIRKHIQGLVENDE